MTQNALIPKTEANYIAAGGACATCTNFIPPESCKVVQGTISPEGGCDFVAQEQAPVDLNTMLFGGVPSAE